MPLTPSPKIQALTNDLDKVNNDIYKGLDGSEQELKYYYYFEMNPIKLFYNANITDEIKEVIQSIFENHLGKGDPL